MAHLPSLLPLFFLLQILLGVHASVSDGSSLQLDYNPYICSKSYMCGDVSISYPFYLSNEVGHINSTSYYCGYTDLNITCIQDGVNYKAIIQLAGHEYTIKEINYNNKTIVLTDSDALRGGKCPRVRHNVSFDEGWLQYPTSPENLTFLFGCNLSAGDPRIATKDKNRISCKVSSNSPGLSFVFTPGEFDASTESELAKYCDPPIFVPLDGNHMAELENNQTMLLAEYGVMIEKGFELAWRLGKNDGCDLCQKSHGQCAYSQNKTLLGCLCSDGKMAVGSTNCSRPSKSFETFPSF
ncbi:hypothetical protein ABZP36_016231 [Zizania latifolia]